MGYSERVYFFSDDGSVTRLPAAKFNRMWHQEGEDRIEQFAGKAVRCLVVYVELQERVPVDVAHFDSPIFYFDDEGRFDSDRQSEALRLSGQAFPVGLDWPTASPTNIVSITPELSKKRFLEEYQWEPTPEDLRTIYRLIFEEENPVGPRLVRDHED